MYQSYPLAWLSLVTGAVTLSVTGMASLCGQHPLQERLPSDSEIVLAESHLVALNRRRRIIVNYDIHSFHPDIDRWVECRFGHADQHGSQIDTMFFCIDGGNLAHYPSKVIPLAEHAHVRRWLAEGIDCVKVAVDAAHERHLEAFYTYRVNGSDRLSDGTPARIPLKDAHPEWLLDGVWWEPGFWDFTVPEVRAHKLAIVRELVLSLIHI